MQNEFNQQMSASQVISQSSAVNCQSCGSAFFETSIIFRKLSKILTGSSSDQLVPIMGYRCQDCHEILRETIPPELVEAMFGDDESDDDDSTKIINI